MSQPTRHYVKGSRATNKRPEKRNVFGKQTCDRSKDVIERGLGRTVSS